MLYIKKPFVQRLDPLLNIMSQKLRCPNPEAGQFGITLRGPMRRKFVKPYDALAIDVMSEAIPK